jgi:hypothetical protein
LLLLLLLNIVLSDLALPCELIVKDCSTHTQDEPVNLSAQQPVFFVVDDKEAMFIFDFAVFNLRLLLLFLASLVIPHGFKQIYSHHHLIANTS